MDQSLKYSPQASLLMKLLNVTPNQQAENLVTSPSNFLLEKLGWPEQIDTGIKNDWKTPATYGVNAAASRQVIGNLLDTMAGMGLAKYGPVAAKGVAQANKYLNTGISVESKAKALKLKNMLDNLEKAMSSSPIQELLPGIDPISTSTIASRIAGSHNAARFTPEILGLGNKEGRLMALKAILANRRFKVGGSWNGQMPSRGGQNFE
jgi:hypothetical protein